MTSRDQQRYDRLRADQAVVDQCAAFLRHTATVDAYAGFQRQEVAYALAGLLDGLSRSLGELGELTRANIVGACELILRWSVERSEPTG